MLQNIRDRAQGWLAWVIVILISVPFALWGVYEYLGGSPNISVAEVNGVELPVGQFRQAYRRHQDYLRDVLGPDVDPALLEGPQIKMAVLRELINGEVLLQSGLEQGMRIGDEQLAEAISARPAFQKNGVFSDARYRSWLRTYGFTAGTFEQEYRRSLLLDQVQYAITDTALVGNRDARNILRLRRQKRLFTLMSIPAERFLNNEITEDAIRDHYDRNQSRFVKPESVSVRYIELTPDQLSVIPDPTEDELRYLYEQDIATGTDSESAPSFEESRERLTALFWRRHKEQIFFDAAEQLANLTFENPDTLAVAADTMALAIKETPLFDRTGSLADAGDSSDNYLLREPQFLAAAFSEDVLEAGYNSEPIELDDYRVIVLRLGKRLAPAPRSLDEVRQEIEEYLDAQKAVEQVVELGTEIVEQLESGGDQVSLAKTYDLVLRQDIKVDRNGSGEALEIVSALFRMSRPQGQQMVYEGIVTSLGNYAIIGLQEVIEEPITDKDAVAVAATSSTLARSYGEDEYQAYLRTLRTSAEVRIHEANL